MATVSFLVRAGSGPIERLSSPVHVEFRSRIVDKIKSGQEVISARPNWLNGVRSAFIHGAGMPSREGRAAPLAANFSRLPATRAATTTHSTLRSFAIQSCFITPTELIIRN